MNTNLSNSDVWVVHQQTANLFRQRDSMWNKELSIPFDEFSGSAAALSSLSQGDTQVYLDVGVNNQAPESTFGQGWAGIATDPVRLVHVPLEASHEVILRDLKIMGKAATVISSGQAERFHHAIHLTLLQAFEMKLLKQRLQQEKQGLGSRLSDMAFCLRMWLAPQPSYQLLRGLTLASLVAGAMLMLGLNESQTRHQETRSIQQRHKDMQQELDTPLQVQFSSWAEQVRKFGQGQRANIHSLRISWTATGNVHTHLDLARERKRVPKGCRVIEGTSIQCSTGEESK